MIDQGLIFLDWQKIVLYNQEISNGNKVEIFTKNWNKEVFCVEFSKEESDTKIIIFNKPLWYVVSKSDPNNKTIYDILPSELRNYYYIWRLDKDSHWLLLLTNNPKLVNEYEHPRNQIEKIYIVQINGFLKQSDIKKCLDGIKDEWETLSMKNIKKLKNTKAWMYEIILTEWKKRHIRRMFKCLWFNVIDLQRIAEWSYKLWNLKIWELKFINLVKQV